MAVLSEITELLRRWDVWRRVEEAPNRVDDLELRVAELEKALERCPADGCPYCGARAFRLKLQDSHGTREVWACQECGKEKEIKTPGPGRAGTWGRRP